jgi:hypothetical protein
MQRMPRSRQASYLVLVLVPLFAACASTTGPEALKVRVIVGASSPEGAYLPNAVPPEIRACRFLGDFTTESPLGLRSTEKLARERAAAFGGNVVWLGGGASGTTGFVYKCADTPAAREAREATSPSSGRP